MRSHAPAHAINPQGVRFIAHAKQHYDNKITVPLWRVVLLLELFQDVMFHSLSQLRLQRNYIKNNIRYLFDHCMNVTFAGSRSNTHGRWFDPKNWLDEQEYGVDAIETMTFSHHFSIPLAESGLSCRNVFPNGNVSNFTSKQIISYLFLTL